MKGSGPAVQRIALMLMPLVGVTSLLGGCIFWLRRVGWLQAATYWKSNTELIESAPDPNDDMSTYLYVLRHHASLHQLDGWLYLTKYAKEAVFAAFVILALSQLPKSRLARPFGLAYTGLFLTGLLSAVTAMVSGHWFALLAGARSFAAWTIGGSATSLIDSQLRRRLARVCAWTLMVEACLAAIELDRGLLIYSVYLFDRDIVRVVGTFSLPISLGTFAVVTWATALCWGEFSRRTLILLTVLLLALLLVNASATAWAALAISAVAMALPTLGARWRSALIMAVLPLALMGWQLLPDLTGRPDVHDSLWGRILPIQLYASEHLSTREVLFGTGFGIGTNAMAQHGEGAAISREMPDRPVGDSMPAALFWQVGLVGLVCAYALFLLALRADEPSRPIGMALLVSSVAVNVTELFPVNLILGFWLASATFKGRTDGEH
jgi:hypothetical protein